MAEAFEEACPQYIAMGMTYEQFWDGDNSMVIPYRKAYQIRQEEINNNAWLQGLYIFKALQCAPIYVNGFVPKGAKIEPYFDKPIQFEKPEKTQKKQDVREQKKQNAISFMQQVATRFNQQFERKRQEQRLSKNPPGKE